MNERVVILGGGTGGLVAANRLRKTLPRATEVILVDSTPTHLFNPSLLWLLVGWRARRGIEKPLSLLERKGVRFVHADVVGIDFDGRKVFTSAEDLAFDYLVLALGASTFPGAIPGFSEGAYDLYDPAGTEKAQEAIGTFKSGRVAILITSIPFKCPAAPYEAALLLSAYFANSHRDVTIEVITPEPQPMPVAGPEVGKMLVSLLQTKGVQFSPERRVSRIDPEKHEIAFEHGETVSYDLLLGVPPHGLPPVLEGSPVLGESGWAKVNPGTLETDMENVYALGDVTAIPLPVGKPLPKAGVFAHFQAEVVAERIRARIAGGSPTAEFDGRGYCFIELGDGRAGYASGNFYADPRPVVHLKRPARRWHWGKVVFEKWWLWKWFSQCRGSSNAEVNL